MPPILGVHLCWGAYGFWLPNDPRGSGSRYVWSEALFAHGPATGLDDRRRSVARRPHDRRARLAAKASPNRPAVRFNGLQARALGRGFHRYVLKHRLTVWACAILPELVHLVIGPFHIPAHDTAERLKAAATATLNYEGLHPFADLAKPNETPPKCWQRGEWAVFLHTEEEIRREIEYVEGNPEKEGKRRQEWPFVTEYTG